MILSKNPKKPYLLLLLLGFVIMISLPLDKKYYRGIAFDNFDKANSFDLGFSSLPNLVGRETFWGVNRLKAVVKTIELIPNIISYNFSGNENLPEIKRVDLEIKFKHYKKLIEDRERSIKNDVGFDFREVKSKITFDGKSRKSKVRLKGLLADHWRSSTRLSFRVTLKGNNTLYGYKKFSINKPSARQHPYEQTFQELQKKLNNIAPKHNYIHLFVNGEDWGIMNVEEHMTKELLEKQRFKESIIFRFGNTSRFRYNATKNSFYEPYILSDPFLNVKIYSSEKYLNEDIYRKWYSYVAKEHLEGKLNLYDTESFTKSLIMAMVWNSTHTLASDNSRYYFNPYSLKLKTITTDQSAFSRVETKLHLPSIYKKIIKSSAFENNFEKNAEEVKTVLLNAQNTMDKWQQFFPLDQKISTNILKENASKVIDDYKNYLVLEENKEGLNSNKKLTKEQSNDLLDHIYARHFDNGEIHIYNLLNEGIDVKSISVDGKLITGFKSSTIKGHNYRKKPFKIFTNLKSIYDNKILVKTINNGFEREYTIDFTHLTKDLFNPLLENSNLEKLKYLEKKEGNNYTFNKGSWNITEPLIINGNISIEKGTTLSFSNNCYMIVKGSVKLNGTEKEKIILKATDDYWKGIYVFEANERSSLNNVVIQNTTFLIDGILNLTGGVNFYKSDVDISNTLFKNSVAEDALNIVKSDFMMDKVKIDSSISDGFDSDFSKGIIKNSLFQNITGDGVDFSGSNVKIIRSSFTNIKDKAVSSGEESNLFLDNLIIENVGVGVASKDGSVTIAKNLSVTNYTLNALMTYTKKSFYKIPELLAQNIKVDSIINAYSRQSGTIMEVDGVNIIEEEVDVETMYQGTIMKK